MNTSDHNDEAWSRHESQLLKSHTHRHPSEIVKMGQSPTIVDRSSWHRLRLLIVTTLILLTVQGWFGDSVNIFLIPTTPPNVDRSFNGILQAIENIGPILVIHAFIGLAILAFSIIVLGFSLKNKPRNVQVPSILGLVMVVLALIGGVLFVLSGFSAGGNSAQMGVGFIGAYAFYFIELYYAK